MKLSLRGEYALRALIVLGLSYGDSVVRTHVISAQQNIPKRFLEQILTDLKVARLVESRRGVAGGYRLRVPPDRITLAEVVRHIEGPLAPVSCVSERFYQRCSCPNESKCAIRSVMKEVRDAIAKLLENYTVAHLCERARLLDAAASNPVDFII
jgi:Rrf2 family protein